MGAEAVGRGMMRFLSALLHYGTVSCAEMGIDGTGIRRGTELEDCQLSSLFPPVFDPGSHPPHPIIR